MNPPTPTPTPPRAAARYLASMITLRRDPTVWQALLAIARLDPSLALPRDVRRCARRPAPRPAGEAGLMVEAWMNLAWLDAAFAGRDIAAAARALVHTNRLVAERARRDDAARKHRRENPWDYR